MSLDSGMISYTGLACVEAGGRAGLAAVRIGVTSEEGQTVRVWLVWPRVRHKLGETAQRRRI